MSDDDDEKRARQIAENIRRALGTSATVIVPPAKPKPTTGKVLAFKPKSRETKHD